MLGRLPDHFQIFATHACYRPEQRVHLQQAIGLVSGAIRFARDNRIERLLIDSRKLTGFQSPTVTERYLLAEQFAVDAMGQVKLALLIEREMIHPKRFGVLVARNRGLRVEVFDSEPHAIEWLMDTLAK